MWIIDGCRDTSINLRSQLNRIIRRAGLQPWPKLWQNLRSTRETELAETFPLHVVVKWIGNSQQVAAKHYLQVTDAHFESAASQPTGEAPIAAVNAVETTQHPTQQASEMACKSAHPESGQERKTPVFPRFATTCGIVNICEWAIQDSNL